MTIYNTVDTLLDAYETAQDANNAAAIKALYDADAVVVSPWRGAIIGQQAISNWVDDFTAKCSSPDFKFLQKNKSQFPKLPPYDRPNNKLVRGRQLLKVKIGGQQQPTQTGRYVLEVTDRTAGGAGDWIIVAQAWTVSP